jgi:hypothetical protein
MTFSTARNVFRKRALLFEEHVFTRSETRTQEMITMKFYAELDYDSMIL